VPAVCGGYLRPASSKRSLLKKIIDGYTAYGKPSRTPLVLSCLRMFWSYLLKS